MPLSLQQVFLFRLQINLGQKGDVTQSQRLGKKVTCSTRSRIPEKGALLPAESCSFRTIWNPYHGALAMSQLWSRADTVPHPPLTAWYQSTTHPLFVWNRVGSSQAPLGGARSPSMRICSLSKAWQKVFPLAVASSSGSSSSRASARSHSRISTCNPKF